MGRKGVTRAPCVICNWTVTQKRSSHGGKKRAMSTQSTTRERRMASLPSPETHYTLESAFRGIVGRAAVLPILGHELRRQRRPPSASGVPSWLSVTLGWAALFVGAPLLAASFWA